MRVPSGSTDRYIYFVAVDSTDYVTRETGLSSFTVYRSRNGGAAAAFTTPTVNEVDSTNMPGLYELLLDEDTTIGAGSDTEELALHITHAGMHPVTRTVELYRPETTAGQTLTVSSGTGNAAVQSIVANAITATSIASSAITSAKIAASAIGATQIASNAITAAKLATDAITAAKIASDAIAEIQSGLSVFDSATDQVIVATNNDKTGYSISGTVTNLDTALTAVDGIVDGYTSGTATTVSTINTKIGTLADLGSGTTIAFNLRDIAGATFSTSTDSLEAVRNRGDSAWVTATGFSTFDNTSDQVIVATNNDKTGYSISGTLTTLDALDTAQDTQHSTTQSAISGLNDPTAASIADAVWDEAQSGHTTAGTFGRYLDAAISGVSTGGVSAADIADAVWDEARSGHTTAGTFGEAIGDGVTAWVTATGFSTHNASDVRAEIDSNSTQLAAIVLDTGTTIPAQISGLNDLSTSDIDARLAAYNVVATTDLPTNFSDLTITATTGLVSLAADQSGVTIGTVTTNTDMRGTDSAYTGTPPTAAAIADAVWDESQSGHTTAGTFGLYVDAAISGVSTGGVSVADIADAVWDEARSGHTTDGTFGDVAEWAGGGSSSASDVADEVISRISTAGNKAQ